MSAAKIAPKRDVSLSNLDAIISDDPLKQQQQQKSWSLGEILNSDKSRDFTLFNLKEGNILMVAVVTLLQTLFYGLRIFVLSRPGVPLAYKGIAYIRIIVPMLAWTYIYFLSKYVPSNVHTKQGKRITHFGNAVIVLHAICSGLVFLSWVLTRDQCHSDWCLQEFPKQTIPLGQLLHQIAGSIVMPLFFTCHNVSMCLFSIVVAYTLIIAGAVLLHLPLSEIVYLGVAGTIIFFLFVYYERFRFFSFTSYSQLETLLREKLASENNISLTNIQTEEMRHMIGNVAHDLRTPLQAFQSELDNLRDTVKELLGDRAMLPLRSVTQLDRICNFMNMTINRSIDFTKASSGIKLNPSIESINFAETLSWAVGCMMKSHTNVPIVIAPVNKRIYNQIYTDKQWLMENLLCLLSNAQKFTTEGEINIRCSLQTSFKPTGGASEAKQQVPKDGYDDIEMAEVSQSCEETSLQNQTADCMLFIEVEDTGIGITKENKAKLFQPFMQAQRRTGGTGLGLYSLAKRVESLGGTCGVEDRSDGKSGSCFWVSIPYKPDRPASEGMSTRYSVHEPVGGGEGRGSMRLAMGNLGSYRNNNNSMRNNSCRVNSFRNNSNRISSLRSCVSKESHDSCESINNLVAGFLNQPGDGNGQQGNSTVMMRMPHLKILLVDDSVMIRKATSRALSKDGHEVEVAQHGAECIKKLEQSKLDSIGCDRFTYNLILMDLQMPVMDGLEATKRIRAMESAMVRDDENDGSEYNNPHITIIGISANSKSEARADCVSSGMDGFIEKPLRMNTFKTYYMKLCSK